MTDSGKAPEPMETNEMEKSSKGGASNAGGPSKSATNGTEVSQLKKGNEKPSEKATGKVDNLKKIAAVFSSVSPSYSQLQSGLQDIVKSYVASKSTTTSKSASGSASQTDEKKLTEANGSKRKKEDDSNSVSRGGGDDDRKFYAEYLDRTKSDFYCKVCDSHMNSEQMWENHVQGKRHLKNIKKDPGEPPSKVKAVKTDQIPQIQKQLDNLRDPVVGLDYMCELQRAESYLDPTYSCFLCHATCTITTVVDHILGTKHRLQYLKTVNPSEYALVEEMKLKKSGLTSISEDYAREFERKRGRGRMEVKIEKPKTMPPPSKRSHYFDEEDDDDTDMLFRRRSYSPTLENSWRRDLELGHWSPRMLSSQQPPIQQPNYVSMSMVEKLNILRQLTSNLIVVSENEGKEVMQIINALTQSLLQYKIRVLPPQLQDTLARHIISGDTQALESTLGLRGSGMSNVGNVITSMAASGDLPMRSARRALSPIPSLDSISMPSMSSRMGLGNSAPNPSGRIGFGSIGSGPNSDRSLWGSPGSGMARMPTPSRVGYEYNPTSYPSSSQWQGGMGSSSYRSDRSSLGY